MPALTEDTSFTRDVLGRYFGNTFDEASATDLTRFNVIVIGGGSFGALIADQIFDRDTPPARRHHRILVLESGPMLLPEHVQNLPPLRLRGPTATTLEELRNAWRQQFGDPIPALIDRGMLNAERGLEGWGLPWHAQPGQNASDPKDKRFPGLAYCLAGRSLFWGGWSPELIDSELTAWPPEVVNDFKARHFREAAQQLGSDVANEFIFGPLHDALRRRLVVSIGAIPGALPVASAADVEAPLAVQSAPPRSGFFPFNKFSTLPILLQAVRDSEEETPTNDWARRLMVLPRCHVRRLHLDQNQRVMRIETNRGDIPVLPSSIVIIALGTIESTRLALLSFPNSNGLIGKNLMAHLRSNTTIHFPRAALGAGLPGDLQASALFLKGRTANGHFHLQITACGVRGDVRDSEAELFKKIPDIDQASLMATALQSVPDDQIVITLRGIGEMEPNPTLGAHSRIEVDPEVDENGVNRAKVILGLTQRDLDLWNDMDAAAVEAARQLAGPQGLAGLRFLNGNTWAATPFTPRDGLGSTHHEAGTLWMGTDPNQSVTNPVGRFHEVGNAYAVGPSLFPASGSPNPMLGGLALVRRTAEWLVPPDTVPLVETGFTALFDGTSTADWRMAGPGLFVLEARDHGIIRSEGGIGLFWYTPQMFQNFILRLEWQASRPDDNSGVFIRFPDPGNDPFVAVREGYEIQIDGRGRNPQGGLDDPLHMTGAVYGFAPARSLASRLIGEWNTFEITADGQSISVVLNDEAVVNGFVGNRRPDGFIGIQNHGAPSRVAFRNIRIKEI
ncbi:family 16 glycoside hydrolase [Mesorhizobium sp.]|uniref:family 16 glycoside hydrolase n=1 Tax=Mesorhizobium sp. TaxID=1871066 RepID=UPI000FE9D009|nr:family 16 glycoside hydrolase [Mesorhizobium sp.]RWP58619.1 MAG: DUF1080 domain-containing protein [Mesorhizobium sp.]